MTSAPALFRGLVAPPHSVSAEELAERADRVVATLRDLSPSEAALVLRVALEKADPDGPGPATRGSTVVPLPV